MDVYTSHQILIEIENKVLKRSIQISSERNVYMASFSYFASYSSDLILKKTDDWILIKLSGQLEEDSI